MNSDNTEYIYGLHCEDYPGTIIYVGRSNNPKRRLGEHIRESTTGQTKKCKVLRALINEGETITFKILETVNLNDPSSAEDLWKTNLEADGHPLTNSKNGDTDRFIPTLLDIDSQPWTANLLQNAQWIKNEGFSTTGWIAWIKGVLFIRQGWSKLKMRHPHYSDWEIEGYDWDTKCKNAAEMLTPGSDENKKWMRCYQSSKRIKPSQYD